MYIYFFTNTVCALPLEERKTELSGKDQDERQAVTPTRRGERPKSLPFHVPNADPPVIRESPEFALDKVFPEKGKAALTMSLDSGSSRFNQLPAPKRSPKPRGAIKNPDSGSQVRILTFL